MGQSIAAAVRDGLIATHHERQKILPNASQKSGYAKVGAQVEKFFFQFSTLRNLERCRQIFCANIPQICRNHEINEEALREELDSFLIAHPNEDLWIFYQQVLMHHETSPKPVAPSAGGCLVPLALVFSGISFSAIISFCLY